MSEESMIGIFDSGLGGLTVVKEIRRQLPGYNIVYFGDTARTPYGTKSKAVVTSFAVEDAEFLIGQGARIIVVACNTASALAIDELRRRVRVPVFEVVGPAVVRAARVSRGKVGVIGTRGTVKSGVYEAHMDRAAPAVKVYAQACPLFVPLVEEGMLAHAATRTIANDYLRPLRSRGVDTLILGCTHYPFLRPVIRREMGPDVTLVDPARETAAHLKSYLKARPELDATLTRSADDRFFVSDRTEHFERLATRWLGRPIVLQEARAEKTRA